MRVHQGVYKGKIDTNKTATLRRVDVTPKLEARIRLQVEKPQKENLDDASLCRPLR